ncbi:MAG: family 20 glycosylhydrolase [Candidatus Coproplasma sp.]
MKLELRCLQLDLARQKESLDFIEEYMRFAAEHGYNTIVLYLENAIRTQCTSFFSEEETYSEEEIRHVVTYGQSLGLDVIPALENLGHLEKFFLYPQLENLSEITELSQGRGFDNFPHGACGCITNPELLKFTDQYIREVCALFNSPYVHMGLDEPFDLAVCDRCKAAIASGTSKADLFLNHILHTYELCKSMGKTMMMWDDFFEYADIVEQLPRDIILCNWNYVFVGDEPQGHWINRIKKDWFRLYDSLGFRYIFCVYAHRASSAYNVDTFTAYAEKYSPMGAIMTAWRRSDSFYQGAYPQIAYAGGKWSGKINNLQDRIDAYSAVLDGNEEAAKLLLSLNIVDAGGWGDVTSVCENDCMVKLIYRDWLSSALERLQSYIRTSAHRTKDILTDIYDYVYEIYLTLLMQKLGVDIFDGYEVNRCSKEEYLYRLDEIRKGYKSIENNARELWAKYRSGIVSCRGALENKYKNIYKKLDNIGQAIGKDVGCVLYADIMLHDPYPTVHNEITAIYEDGSEERVYIGSLKPSFAQTELGGCYGYRFAMKREPVKIKFASWGEGAIYPLHFRYVSGKKKYVASEVKVIKGTVLDEQNILYEDTQFAAMGENDGVKHFNDISLSKVRHEIEISFCELSGSIR